MSKHSCRIWQDLAYFSQFRIFYFKGDYLISSLCMKSLSHRNVIYSTEQLIHYEAFEKDSDPIHIK